MIKKKEEKEAAIDAALDAWAVGWRNWPDWEAVRDRMRRAIAAYCAAPGWQPIETAPKDGTPVLLYPNWRIAWWEFGDEQWMRDAIPVKFGDNRPVIYEGDGEPQGFHCLYADAVAPTHWMPLPPPPKENER